MRMTVKAKDGKFYTSATHNEPLQHMANEFKDSPNGHIVIKTDDGRILGFKEYDYVEFEEDEV